MISLTNIAFKLQTPGLRWRRRCSVGAFSLVEVVIAVGIMALGIVAVLGLLPHGLAMTKKTADLTYQSRIFQHLLSEYQTMTWGVLTAGSSSKPVARYFDYQGVELNDHSTTQQELFTSYVADVRVIRDPVELPHVEGRNSPNDSLRRLVVRIAATPNRDFDFNAESPRLYATYAAQLARTY